MADPGIPARLTDEQLIDTVAYLASLASEPSAIDQSMDTLRLITSSWSKKVSLTEQNRQDLQRLATYLKTYLINQDPLREFTEQTLELRLQDRTLSTHTYAFDFKIAVLSSLAVAILSLLIPAAPSWGDRIVLAVPIFLLCTTLANVWFYLSALRNFKPELRRIFLYWCVGSVGLGIQFIHFVSITLLGQEHTPLYKYGGLTIIAALALLAIYLGLRKYALALTLKTRFASLKLLVGVLLATTAIAVCIPLVFNLPDPAYFSFSLASLLALSSIALCGAYVAHVILRSVTAAYAQSMKRLQIFTVGVCNCTNRT